MEKDQNRILVVRSMNCDAATCLLSTPHAVLEIHIFAKIHDTIAF